MEKYLELASSLPKRMAYETTENKKAGYVDLVSEMREQMRELEADYDRMAAATFLVALVDTVLVTSPEIYEHYRAIVDMMRELAKRLISEKADLEASGRILLSYGLFTACENQLLLGEKYLPIAVALAQELQASDAEGTLATCCFEKMQPLFEKYKGVDFGIAGLTESYEEQTTGCVKMLVKTARSLTLSIEDGGIYETKECYNLYVNDVFVKQTNNVVSSIYNVKPNSCYKVEVKKIDGSVVGTIIFTTKTESATLNVRELGAAGDGVQDDTTFIQAAIMACPKNGRVLVPAGVYRITQIFLRSHMSLELAKGAELRADATRESHVRFPGQIVGYDESVDLEYGTWEGNPLPMFAGIVSGVGVEDATLYGEGTVNGNASKEDWWNNPKVMRMAFRPRTLFLNHCKNITVQGVKFCNSPSWTLHPFFSDDLGFYNVVVENPSDSPNTDGLDPESCKNVEIVGVRFSLGDDCIAIKSGKIYMGKKFKQPSENLHIYQCLMENGHGAVTIGSEMAGGVKNLVVENCMFRHTDRGLRIKTRRGRGEDAIIDGILFKNIDMDHVMTPFVVNSFYFCDPDGRTEYVQSRDMMPVDDRTPLIKKLEFTQIHASNCHVAAAHFDGLPEQKIEEIVMKDVSVTYADEPKCDVPAMSEGVEACTLKGIFARNVKKLTLDNVSIEGQVGEAMELIDCNC